MSQATLVNVSIFCTAHHRLLLPWKILPIGSPGRTVEQFFHDVAAPLVQVNLTWNLMKLFLVEAKTILMKLISWYHLMWLFDMFGAYVRYVTSQQSEQVEGRMRVNEFQEWWRPLNVSCVSERCYWRLLYCAWAKAYKEGERKPGASINGRLFHLLVEHLYRVRDISCEQPIEQLYYTAKCPPICVYCAHSLDEADSDSGYFPQCVGCKNKPKIKV